MMKRLFLLISGLFSHKADAVTAAPAPTTVVTTVTTTPAEVAVADVQKAIDIVNNLKNALSSPFAVLITTLIPSEIDDKIRETLVADLPMLSAGLSFFKGVLSTDKSTAINQVLDHVKFSADEHKNAFYHTLAAKLLMTISGGSISWSKALLAVEYVLKEAVLHGPDTSATALPAQSAVAMTGASDAPGANVAAPVVQAEQTINA